MVGRINCCIWQSGRRPLALSQTSFLPALLRAVVGSFVGCLCWQLSLIPGCAVAKVCRDAGCTVLPVSEKQCHAKDLSRHGQWDGKGTAVEAKGRSVITDAFLALVTPQSSHVSYIPGSKVPNAHIILEWGRHQGCRFGRGEQVFALCYAVHWLSGLPAEYFLVCKNAILNSEWTTECNL